MPIREAAPLGAPCWIDLLTSDAERARAFYRDLFGWTAEAPSDEFGGYFMFTKGGVPIAGGMPAMPDQAARDVWSVYLAVDDAQKIVEMAPAHGSEVLVQPMPIADLGTMAVLVDPGGAQIGAWQPDTFHGIGALGEASTPGWFELHARDYKAAVGFYRDVFGWDPHVVSDTPEFRLTVQQSGDDMLAGIMEVSADRPPRWMIYFAVDDADAALERLVKLGGEIVSGAEDTQYGRIAHVADPTGAEFKLVAPNEAMPARDPARGS